LLLLTDFAPDLQGGGGVILRSLLTPEDRQRMVWVTLSPLNGSDEHPVVSLASAGGRSLLRDATIRTPLLRRAVRGLIERHNAAAVWIVAHGASVRVAPAVTETGIPVHMTIHDDPAWGYALLTRRYLVLAPLLARDLGRSLRSALSADVVTQAQAKRYRGRYGVESVIVNRGLCGPVEPSPAHSRRDEVSVAVLGSTYGFRELGVLAQALGLLAQQLRIDTRLTVIGRGDGRRVRQICPPGVALEITGHLDEPAGIEKLRESFLLYMSYPFGPRGMVLRTTSFPTKLSTYVMAARPLLLHTPADSSVAFLGATAPYATLWSSLTAGEGAEIIARLWLNEQTRQSFHVAAEQVREQHFDLHRNRAHLYSSLNALVSEPMPGSPNGCDT
jgi:hypothetical protein